MQVYNYNLAGVFLSESEAQESPLEPGVFLLPAHATFTAPPSVPDGKQAVWNGGAWELQDLPPQPTEEELAEARAKAEAVGYLASTDWMVIRLSETREPIPDDVLAERARARAIVDGADPDVPRVPGAVTMRQARLALLAAGYLDRVQEAFANIPDEQVKKAAMIEWEYAGTVERRSPFTTQMAALLGLSSDDLDRLFTAAAAL